LARPQKEGLDYFPLDIDMDQDDKVLLIEAKHKITGFAVLIKLLMKIYKEGYFYKWTEREQLLLSSKVNVDINIITEIVSDCIKWEFFNSSLYLKYEILTSGGIQKRYFKSVERRKEITLISEYLLISPPKQTDNFTVNMVYVDGNNLPSVVNVDINPLEDGLFPTEIPKEENSKGKEVKERKENDLILLPDEIDLIRTLEKVKDYPIDRAKELKMYRELQERYPTIDILGAIKDWSFDKLDKPLDVKSKPRSQINTWLGNCVKWGKNLKAKGGNKTGSNSIDQGDSKPWETDPILSEILRGRS